MPPVQSTLRTTRDQRLQVQTLRLVGYTYQAIADILHLTYRHIGKKFFMRLETETWAASHACNDALTTGSAKNTYNAARSTDGLNNAVICARL